jgi:hypothetical protein
VEPAPAQRQPSRLVLAAGGLVLTLALPLALLLSRAVAVDESEFVAATVRVHEGLVPYRDFWEHHFPLQWYAMADWVRLGDPPSVADVVRLRALQSVLWIAFGVAFVHLLRRRGCPPAASFAALSLLASSVLFSTFAVEYRIDVPMNCFFVIGLLLAERSLGSRGPGARREAFASGAAFALAALSSQRMVPGVAVALVLYALARADARLGPRPGFPGVWLGAGSLAAVVAALLARAGALEAFLEQNILQNALYERLATQDGAASPSAIWPATLAIEVSDVGSFLLAGAGAAAPFLAWRDVKARAFTLRLLVLLGTQVFLVSGIRSPYPYHLGTALILLALLAGVALAQAESRRPGLAVPTAVLAAVSCSALAWSMSDFRIQSSIARYQDHTLSVVTRVSGPGEKVLDGCGLAWHRRSAFDLWFLRPIAMSLTKHGLFAPLGADLMVRERPAAVVADFGLLAYLPYAPGLAPFLVRNYLPLERAVWIPAPNARLAPGEAARWTVLRSGAYAFAADTRLEGHPWFRNPLAFPAMGAPRVDAFALDLGSARRDPALRVAIDGRPIEGAASGVHLTAGQVVEARNQASAPMGVVLRPAGERVFFRDPFPSVPLWGTP